jgi:hypothetical protein
MATGGVGSLGTPNSESGSSPETRYLARLDDMQLAATELRGLLDQLIASCDGVRAQMKDGKLALHVVQSVGDESGRAFRRELHSAARRFERKMQATRGESFRILINEGQRSLTDVARTAGLSAQMVKRLVESVAAEDHSSGPSS